MRLELQHTIAATYWLSAYYVRTYDVWVERTGYGCRLHRVEMLAHIRRLGEAYVQCCIHVVCVFVFRRNPSLSHGISVNQDWIQPFRTFSPVKSTASTRFACVFVVFRGSRTFSVATLHTSAVFLSPTIRPYLKKSIHERSSGPLR